MASTASAAFIKRQGATTSSAPKSPAYIAVEGLAFCKGATKKADTWAMQANEGQQGDPDSWTHTWPPFLVYTGSTTLADPAKYGEVLDVTRKNTNSIVFVRYNVLFPVNFPGDKGFAGPKELDFPMHTRMYSLAADQNGIPVSKYDRSQELLPSSKKTSSKAKKSGAKARKRSAPPSDDKAASNKRRTRESGATK